MQMNSGFSGSDCCFAAVEDVFVCVRWRFSCLVINVNEVTPVDLARNQVRNRPL